MRSRNKYIKQILNVLLDKYEASKTFNGRNKVRQSFKIKTEILFPKYADHSEFQIFDAVNSAIDDLVEWGYIEKPQNSCFDVIVLNENKCDEIYQFLKRQPKKNEMEKILKLLNCYEKDESPIGEFARQQIVRIADNKSVEIFKGDIAEFGDILRASSIIIANNEEIFTRDMSIKIFGDSKKLAKLKDKIQRLLSMYATYDDRSYILEEYGVVNAPSVLRMKGNARLVFASQDVELESIGGEMVLSTKSMKEIKRINLVGEKVITVENLTTYYDYPEGDDLIIYLEGFHNRSKAELLELIHRENIEKKYLHFGDIDIGGFHIYRNLCSKTGIPFKLHYMNKDILIRYKNNWVQLNKSEVKRLKSLRKILDNTECEIEEMEKSGIRDTLDYMEINNCKLEQEVIGLDLRKNSHTY